MIGDHPWKNIVFALMNNFNYSNNPPKWQIYTIYKTSHKIH